MTSSNIIVEIIREKDWNSVVKLLRSPDAYYHATQLYPLHEDQRSPQAGQSGDSVNDDNPSTVLLNIMSSSSSLSTTPSKSSRKDEYIPLINMCIEHEEISLLLLDLDPEPLSVFISSETGDTCLHTACRHASRLSAKTLDKMLTIAPSALTHTNKDNELPFHCALAGGGSLGVIKMVLFLSSSTLSLPS